MHQWTAVCSTNDAERVRVGPSVYATFILNALLQHTQKQSPAGGNQGRDIRCVPLPMSLQHVISLLGNEISITCVYPYLHRFTLWSYFWIDFGKKSSDAVHQDFQ